MCRKTIFKLSGLIRIRPWLENHPREAILAMLLCMAVSAGLSFTVMRYPSSGLNALKPPQSGSGLSPANTAKALLEAAELQIMMETILSKDTLSHSDSMLIDSAVRRLQELQKKQTSK